MSVVSRVEDVAVFFEEHLLANRNNPVLFIEEQIKKAGKLKDLSRVKELKVKKEYNRIRLDALMLSERSPDNSRSLETLLRMAIPDVAKAVG